MRKDGVMPQLSSNNIKLRANFPSVLIWLKERLQLGSWARMEQELNVEHYMLWRYRTGERIPSAYHWIKLFQLAQKHGLQEEFLDKLMPVNEETLDRQLMFMGQQWSE